MDLYTQQITVRVLASSPEQARKKVAKALKDCPDWIQQTESDLFYDTELDDENVDVAKLDQTSDFYESPRALR